MGIEDICESVQNILACKHELFVHGVATSGASLSFVYILPSDEPNGILFIKQYFQKNKQFSTCIV